MGSIIIQLITGLLLSSHYSSDITTAYMSVQLIMREVYYGWAIRYTHANGASFCFFFIFAHISRSMYYQTYIYSPNAWITGIIMLIKLMATAFIGYILPFGQMSFWGATVILNLFYIHSTGSSNPLGIQTNNKIPFFPYIVIKDLFGLLIVLNFYILQTCFGVWSFCHPDNNLEANSLETPLHIVPEWYFLSQYAMLKAIPNKNAGFLILISSILILVFFAEMSSLSTMIPIRYGSSLNTMFFICVICLIKVGAQFPQEKFISFARLLTINYYMLVVCMVITK